MSPLPHHVSLTMPGSKEGIIQYNASNDSVELIRSVKVPEVFDTLYQVEEFMTGKSLNLVEAAQLPSVRLNDNLHVWNPALFALKSYVKMVREMHRLVEHHGCNEEVFGLRKEQEFMMATGMGTMHIALRVTNEAMQMALDSQTIGICMDGSLLRHGTVVTFRGFVASMTARKDHCINVVPPIYRDSLHRQFDEAIKVELEEIGKFYSRTLEESWANYLSNTQVQDLLAVSHTTLGRYRSGQVPGDAAPFPNPDRFRGRSPYWHKSSILDWMDSRKF